MNRLQELAGINESSLSRVFQYVEDDKLDFGILSPSRGDLSDEENNQRYDELKQIVRDMGYGFIEMRGGYREDEGNRFVSEKSLFIPKISKENITKLGVKYDQDSVVYKNDKEFLYIGTNNSTGIGKHLMDFKKGSGRDNINLSKKAIKDFFSELTKGSHKGKKFVFNDVGDGEDKDDKDAKDSGNGKETQVKNKNSDSVYTVKNVDPNKHIVIQELESGSMYKSILLHKRGIQRKWITVFKERLDS